MDSRLLLYFLTALSGVAMVVGGMWLIYKQKIYIDRESNQPIEVTIPGGLTFKSNYPALALFALGFFPLIYPIHELSQLSDYPYVIRVKLKGAPTTNVYPALVYAASANASVAQNGDSFSVKVPFIGKGDQEYKVLLIANDHVLDMQTVSRSGDGDITVNFRSTIMAPPEYQTTTTPTPPGYN
jgi:hypothetical protein